MSRKGAEDRRPGAEPGRDPCKTATIPVDALDRFVNSFERSARRWEMVVYPSLLALALLMAYGFFLIYSLTTDIRMIAEKFDPQMGHHMSRLTSHMDSLTRSVEAMNRQVETMTVHTAEMTERMQNLEIMPKFYSEMAAMNAKMDAIEEMKAIRRNMTKITRQLAQMNGSMTYMTRDVGRMRYDMTVMNGNISRPMNFMNSFMPW